MSLLKLPRCSIDLLAYTNNLESHSKGVNVPACHDLSVVEKQCGQRELQPPFPIFLLRYCALLLNIILSGCTRNILKVF